MTCCFQHSSRHHHIFSWYRPIHINQSATIMRIVIKASCQQYKMYLTCPLYSSICEDRRVSKIDGFLFTKHSGTSTAANLTLSTFSVAPGIFHTGLKSAVPGWIGRSREQHRFLWLAVKVSSASDTVIKRTTCLRRFLTRAKCVSSNELVDMTIYKHIQFCKSLTHSIINI